MWQIFSLSYLNLPSELKYISNKIGKLKILKCDLCESTAAGQSIEQWMQNLMPHYITAHPEVMNDSPKTKEN